SIVSTGSPGRGSGAAFMSSLRRARHGRAVALARVVERSVFQVRGIAPADEREALAGEEQAIDRRVAELPRARRVEAEAGPAAVSNARARSLETMASIPSSARAWAARAAWRRPRSLSAVSS